MLFLGMSFGARREISVQYTQSHLTQTRPTQPYQNSCRIGTVKLDVVQNTAADHSICYRELHSVVGHTPRFASGSPTGMVASNPTSNVTRMVWQAGF
jgi:hypothetical protein